jgi:tetratricopeptide (TPR) repeat protein
LHPINHNFMSRFAKFVARAMGTKASATAPTSHRTFDRIASQPAAAEQRSEYLVGLGAEVREHLNAARYPRALAAVDAAMSLWPTNPVLEFLRGTVLQEWGRGIEARDTFLDVARLDEVDPELRHRTTMALLQTSRLGDAERWARTSVALEPDQARTHFLLGVVFKATGRQAEAIFQFERGLALNPDDVDALGYLGWCKCEIGDFASADQILQKAISIDARRPALWTTLGTSKYRQGCLIEAIEYFEMAVRLEFEGADIVGAAANLTLALMDESRFDEIFALCSRALPTQPSAQLHLSLGLSLLAAGRFAEGWPLFEARFFKEPILSRRRVFPRPVWQGQDLEGKTILLAQEQGVGDLIQFVRYAGELKAAGARVLLAPFVGLEEFCCGFDGVDEVVRAGPLPHFDYYCHLMSLPGKFQSRNDGSPSRIPYLTVDEARLTRWETRLATGSDLKVGLVWAGNPEHGKDRERSIALSQLRSLWDLKGVQFYSLQKGSGAADVANVSAGQPMVDLASELNDYRDTAAAVYCLDLVISVDTSVAHVAGALGKPVWTLLPLAADWRWGRTADCTSWYPSMRLFRQSKHLQWDDVIDSLCGELRRSSALDRLAPVIAATYDARLADSVPRVDTEPLPTSPWCDGACCFTQARHGQFQYLPVEDDESYAIGFYGDYLEPILEILSRLVQPGNTIVELGSGIGSHVIPLSRAIAEAGHLIAIEGRERIRNVLQQNLGANHVTNVTVLNLERRETRTSVVLVSPSDQGSSISIDDLGLTSLRLLKFNPGTDAAIELAGASQTLWRLRPTVLVLAANPAEIVSAGMKLFDLSYRCSTREIRLFDEQNFNKRHRDIFTGRKVYLLLAVPEESDVAAPLDGWRALS